MWCNTVDGRNPANQLRLVVYPIYLQGSINSRWCRFFSSIKSIDEFGQIPSHFFLVQYSCMTLPYTSGQVEIKEDLILVDLQ